MTAAAPSLEEMLAAAPVLAGLQPTAVALLAGEGKLLTFAPGEIIIREGDSGHSFYILAEGEVEVLMDHSLPHEVVLARLARRAVFGEMCMIDPVPRAATVRAVGEVRAVEIPAAALHHLYHHLPDQYALVILNVSRDVVRRLRALDRTFAARSG